MQSLQFLPSLRRAHLLARFMLVWLALSIGVAIASPIVKPQATELICSGSGVIKVLVKTDDGSQQVSRFTLDCPLCATNSAPPSPVVRLTAEPRQPLADGLQSIPAARMVALTATPLPARGPPVLS